MFVIYLLESINTGKWYIGYTPADVLKRLDKHNAGEVRSTKAFRPWRLIYFENYISRVDATGREKFLKSGVGRNFLRKQLRNYLLKGLPRVNVVNYTRAASSTGRASPS